MYYEYDGYAENKKAERGGGKPQEAGASYPPSEASGSSGGADKSPANSDLFSFKHYYLSDNSKDTETVGGVTAGSNGDSRDKNDGYPGYEPKSPVLYGTESGRKTQKGKREKKKRSINLSAVVALCLIFSILSGAGAGAAVMFFGNIDTTAAKQVEVNYSDREPSPGIVNSEDGKITPAEIYGMATEQVVSIQSQYQSTNIFSYGQQQTTSGSGVVISSDGYILTNYHVIETALQNNNEIEVTLYSGDTFPAQIIGYEDDNDIAVIKIEAENLSAAILGNSDEMSVGDSVYAVGNPLGELVYTMTGGIISAVDRIVSTDVTTKINMLQIDAAINSGNSGGPVYNNKGEVIGIVTAKYMSSGVEGLAFAIPSSDIKDMVNELIELGYVSGKPSIGIVPWDITRSTAEYYGLVEGVGVQIVNSEGAAARAGVIPGDIITKLNDTEVRTTDELNEVKKQFSAGDTIELTIYRSGEYIVISVTLDEDISNKHAA